MRRLFAVPLAVALALAPLATAQAQHEASAPAGRSANLQGSDPRAFMDNRYIRDFYALSVATLGPGAPKLDVKAYEAKSYEIFRSLGESMRAGGGAAMQDHLKLIPRQVIQIAKDDPKVLQSFEAFTDAMVGPK